MLIKKWEFVFDSASTQELVFEENAILETILVESENVNFKVDSYLSTPNGYEYSYFSLSTPNGYEYSYFSYGMPNEIKLCLVEGTKIKFISNGIGRVLILGRYF